MEPQKQDLSKKLSKAKAKRAECRIALTRAITARRVRKGLEYAKKQGLRISVTWEEDFAEMHGWVANIKKSRRKLRLARKRVRNLTKKLKALTKAKKATSEYMYADGYKLEEVWNPHEMAVWHATHGNHINNHFVHK